MASKFTKAITALVEAAAKADRPADDPRIVRLTFDMSSGSAYTTQWSLSALAKWDAGEDTSIFVSYMDANASRSRPYTTIVMEHVVALSLTEMPPKAAKIEATPQS